MIDHSAMTRCRQWHSCRATTQARCATQAQLKGKTPAASLSLVNPTHQRRLVNRRAEQRRILPRLREQRAAVQKGSGELHFFACALSRVADVACGVLITTRSFGYNAISRPTEGKDLPMGA